MSARSGVLRASAGFLPAMRDSSSGSPADCLEPGALAAVISNPGGGPSLRLGGPRPIFSSPASLSAGLGRLPVLRRLAGESHARAKRHR
jgi:hypothetical protein